MSAEPFACTEEKRPNRSQQICIKHTTVGAPKLKGVVSAHGNRLEVTNFQQQAETMECPREYQPELDEGGKFWKGIQCACRQAFLQVYWDPSKSHWHFQACKFHIFQAVLKRGVSEWEKDPQFIESMKRGLETDSPELYVFSTNADINYKLTLEETKFLRTLHLEDFVTAVSWGVLHTQLVKEAIASFEATTLQTTVKGKSMPLIAKNWRKQFQQVFHLIAKEELPVTKEWTLANFFLP